MSNPVLKYQDLDVAGTLFGLRYESNDQVGLYIEDDENWHHKCSFHVVWLKQLEHVVGRFIDEKVGR